MTLPRAVKRRLTLLRRIQTTDDGDKANCSNFLQSSGPVDQYQLVYAREYGLAGTVLAKHCLKG